MEYTPVELTKETRNGLFKLIIDNKTWLLKRYRGTEAKLHRDTEAARLQLWREADYPVPVIGDISLTDENAPYLIMEWLEGMSLAQYLKDESISLDSKLAKLRTVLSSFRARHQNVTESGDLRWLHHDPNTGNIFLFDDRFCYLDFEGAVKGRSEASIELAAVELAKILRWAARDLGHAHLQNLMQITIEIYHDMEDILQVIVRRTRNRPFNFIHRLKNSMRKKRHPQEITKYDVADTLYQLMA